MTNANLLLILALAAITAFAYGLIAGIALERRAWKTWANQTSTNLRRLFR